MENIKAGDVVYVGSTRVCVEGVDSINKAVQVVWFDKRSDGSWGDLQRNTYAITQLKPE